MSQPDKTAISQDLKVLLAPMQSRHQQEMLGCAAALVLPGVFFTLAWWLGMAWWSSLLVAVGIGVALVMLLALKAESGTERLTSRALAEFNRSYPRGAEERKLVIDLLKRLANPSKSYFMPAAEALVRALENEEDLLGEAFFAPPPLGSVAPEASRKNEDSPTRENGSNEPRLLPLDPEREA